MSASWIASRRSTRALHHARAGGVPSEFCVRRAAVSTNGAGESGTRPTFDVVTGVSTGAIVAVCSFLGPDYDPGLKRFYTTVTNKDVYTKRFEVSGLLSDALADSRSLAAFFLAFSLRLRALPVGCDSRLPGLLVGSGVIEIPSRLPVVRAV